MEKRIALPLLLLVAVSIVGCRELVSPTNGYIWVADKDSPVRIETKDLAGVGWIKAYTQSKEWTEIYRNPSGEFTFNEVLPPEAWHCASGEHPGSERGCVAALRVGDEEVGLSTPKLGRIYVCTQDYKATNDRIHCGTRSMATTVDFLIWPVETFLARASHRFEELALFGRSWKGDQAQRIFTGGHEFTNTNNAWDPAFPSDEAGFWIEYPYDYANYYDVTSTYFLGSQAYSVDIGMCNVFVPYQWSDRHEDGRFTGAIGINTAPRDANGALIANADGSYGLGLAEILVDALIDNPVEQSTYSQNVKKWLNNLTGIWSRTDVSPEFHFRVSESGERQMCLVQYVAANTRINGSPDEWWRFDQSIGALFVQFLGLGDCNTHNARIQYCGSPKIKTDGTVAFTIDPGSVKATMEPYPRIRPICRNQFKPRFEGSMPEILIGPAQVAVSEGLDKLVQGFKTNLGIETERLEITPTGLYLVTASHFLSPGYPDSGDCIGALEGPDLTANLQPAVPLRSIPATGITRPMP